MLFSTILGKPVNKKSSKENRHESASLGKRQKSTRKTPKHQTVSTSKRVLKENKANKKLSVVNNDVHSLETNGVGVQTIISLPVINPMKSSDIKVRKLFDRLKHFSIIINDSMEILIFDI